MNRTQSLTIISAVLILAAWAGCTYSESESRFPTDEAKQLAEELGTQTLSRVVDIENAIQNATKAEQAVILINLDWSIQCVMARVPFAQFMLDYRSSRPHGKLLFHYIDCTNITQDYSPLTDLPGWQELDDKSPGTLISGYGEMVWLKNGQVLRVAPIWDVRSRDKLIKITDELMADR